MLLAGKTMLLASTPPFLTKLRKTHRLKDPIFTSSRFFLCTSTISDSQRRSRHAFLLDAVSTLPPQHALGILEHLSPSRDALFYWNTLIKNTLMHGHETSVALHVFRQMLRLQWRPDGYTYPYILKASGELTSLRWGSALHCNAFRDGLVTCNVFVCNSLVSLYGKCGDLGSARKVFDETRQRGITDVTSWNSISTAYASSGDPGKVMRMFGWMVSDHSLQADVVSLVNVLPACASLNASSSGKEVHGYAIRKGLALDVFVGNALLDMYAKCGLMDEAERIFEGMDKKDLVTWNAMVTGYSQFGRYDCALGLIEKMREKKMKLNVVTWSAVISGYAQRGLGRESLLVFKNMQSDTDSKPNAVTLSSVLSGCAAAGALDEGREIHCYVIKEFLNMNRFDTNGEDDLTVINGLIDMYAKCKSLEVARMVFDSTDWNSRNVVTWTAMIGGYAQHGDASDALVLFSKMLSDPNRRLLPNSFTISCVLGACARLNALRPGRQIHAYVLRDRFESTMLFISNCLIDMYAKSGDVNAARTVFDAMDHRNIVSWTSLMTGYGMHGLGENALQVFHGMRHAGLTIDGVTFLVVLYACSHSGLVEKGLDYFERMSSEFGVDPGVEHYACMVDLLGRAGRLDEATALIDKMPMQPTPAVWVALLGACRTHGKVELAEHAANKLSELDSENDGTYTILSNIYANARQWKDVTRVRLLMRNKGIRKRPGLSWVQDKKGTTTFYAGDRSHSLSEQIYGLLGEFIERIKVMGYVPETSFSLHDVDDEEKNDLLMEHSEKLALAYGVLTTPPGMPIRITKNLRVCGDCHSAMTYISRIIDHEIILRDCSRFHHFKDGACSCRGYW